MKEDIREIIKNKDEQKLRKIALEILEGIIKGNVNKDTVSYYPSFFITVPLELGWKENYKFKNKILEQAFDLIARFESLSEKDAKKKSKSVLVKLKNAKL